MEAIVETTLETTNHFVDKHFDKGWDKYRKWRNGKKVESIYTPYDGTADDTRQRDHSSSSGSSSLDERSRGITTERPPQDGTSAVRSSVEFSGGAPLTGSVPLAAAGAATFGASSISAAYPASRRRQRNTLPSPERNINSSTYRQDSLRSLQQESQISDRILRDYEREVDDPKRAPESVLSSKDLHRLTGDPRRDSGMSGYNDNYAQSQYAGETRPRSQPPRSRYYDEDADSDYDERSGRRYRGGSGRGYDDDDRDYDRVVEETERYRGPVGAGPLVPANRPWGADRRESYRSNQDGPYGAGAVTQYGRRSDGALDRQEASYVSRRTRGRDRDRSYSRSPSESRSRSRDRGLKEKVEDQFDLSARGLGVGVAGAVIGGLAGREFGQKHRQRDIAIGAIIGGLGANYAENKWREWKDNKERDIRDDEERWEQKYDGRDYGRSRSNVR